MTPRIRYPKGRVVHNGSATVAGGWYAACGWVPRWHKGAVQVDEPVSCQRCLHGPMRYAHR